MTSTYSINEKYSDEADVLLNSAQQTETSQIAWDIVSAIRSGIEGGRYRIVDGLVILAKSHTIASEDQ